MKLKQQQQNQLKNCFVEYSVKIQKVWFTTYKSFRSNYSIKYLVVKKCQSAIKLVVYMFNNKLDILISLQSAYVNLKNI